MTSVRSSGTLMCLGSGAAFGAMAIFGKLAYDEGANVGTLLGCDAAAGLALGAGGYALQAGLYFSALQRIDASLLSLLLYTFPAIVACAVTVLLAFAVFGETLGRAQLAGGALVVGAVLVLQAPRLPRTRLDYERSTA